MKKLLPIVAVLGCLLWQGCDKNETLSPYTYTEESGILYGSNQTNFKQILFFIKPYLLVNGTKNYLATDTLYNLTMKVNTLSWAKSNSLGIDTLAFNLTTFDRYRVSDVPVLYPVVATYQTNDVKITTAGQYADLVLNYQTLSAGEYIFRLESFEIKLKDGTVKKVPTAIGVPLTVTSNTRSTYLGEFEVLVKQ